MIAVRVIGIVVEMVLMPPMAFAAHLLRCLR
jgi:hypothetical protein